MNGKIARKLAGVLAASSSVLALSTGLAQAQTPARTPVKGAESQAPNAGVIAGMTLSRVSPSAQGQTVDRSEGILAGVYGRIHPNVKFLRSFMLEADLQFVQKRSTLTDTVNGVTRNADLHMNFLEVPIAFQMPMFKGFYMVEGPVFSFPLSGSLGGVDVKSSLKNPDIGMLMAAGHKIGKKYALEFQYNGGFRTVSDVALGKFQSPQGGVAVQRSRAFMFVVRRSFK